MNDRRKPTAKKHKTWDGDGELIISGGCARLEDDRGRVLGKSTFTKPTLPEIGDEVSIAGRVVQIEAESSKEPGSKASIAIQGDAEACLGRSNIAKHTGDKVKHPLQGKPASPSAHSLKRKRHISSKDDGEHDIPTTYTTNKVRKVSTKQNEPAARLPPPPPKLMLHAKFKTPLLFNNVLTKSDGPRGAPVPRHDPNAEDALTLKRPDSSPVGKNIVDVVVDPILTKHLRPHQREGVSFLYECVMGMRSYGGEGAILADEMGLGKTLQTIALLWTLLKQNPIYEDGPAVKKALIVCPVTLISNWRKEFWKWLGKERVGVLVVDNEKRTKLTDFTHGKAYQVMIIGYEKLTQVQSELQKGVGIDLVIADEAHRLKSAQNQAAAAIKSLNTERRIVLTGTPMQNNLSEYFTLVDFVNPGLLGKYSAFKRKFEDVIIAGQQQNIHSKDRKKAKAKSRELAELTEQFILRRTADVLAKFLPQKTEYVLFCKPELEQAKALRNAVTSGYLGAVLYDRQATLQLIHILKQLCNSPSLVKAAASEVPDGMTDGATLCIRDIVNGIPNAIPQAADGSAKLRVLDSLLQSIRLKSPDEKVVIVSNYTSTLDLVQRYLRWPYLRLDGSTPAVKRGPLVEQFNMSSPDKHFAFLLSAKAGGLGLNLIGASRLILFDTDWNPAIDLQAMARIHRDGQKRHCFIYRLLIMGSIDEKIFQRQVSKMELADEIVDSKSHDTTFSYDELRDLFTFDESGICLTHQSLGCDCGGRGEMPAGPLDADQSKNNTPDEENDAPLSSFVYASSFTSENGDVDDSHPELQGARKQIGIKTFMRYQHIDPSSFAGDSVAGTDRSLEDVVEDTALFRCMRPQGDSSRIAFAFARGSTAQPFEQTCDGVAVPC